MELKNTSGGTIPAHNGRSAESAPVTVYPKDAETQPPSLPTQRHRRSPLLVRLLSILLLIALVLALVRIGAMLSGSNDQVIVSIDNQGTAGVDLRQSIPISPYLYGTNVFTRSYSSSVDQRYSGFMNYGPLITSGLRSAHMQLLRFPGGSWGEEHLLSYDQLNDFSVLLSQVRADGMITVPLTGPIGNSPRDLPSLLDRINMAGDWVDYMNNPHSRLRTGRYAHAPFHAVKFWSVGNEPDLLVNPLTGKSFTVAEYVNEFIQFSLIMHQNNPTIQIFGPEISQFNGVGVGPMDPNGQLWMESFLRGVGTYEKTHPQLKFHLLDGVSFHFYPFFDARKTANLLLSSTDVWGYLLPPLRQLIQQDLGRDVPIAITEINTNPSNLVPPQGLAALWWANTLGSLLDQRVDYVAFFSTESVDLPYPLFTSDGYHQTAMLRVLQIFSHLQRNLVPLQAPLVPVGMHATQDDTHQTISLLFVNTADASRSIQIHEQSQFLAFHRWPDVQLTLFGFSITLVTLHQSGGADAYSYIVPNSDAADNAPLLYSVCGKNLDPLAHTKPC